MTDLATIIGYILFGISEILPLLPIPTNGMFHSMIIGLQNSLKDPNQDIEMARKLLHRKPELANVVTSISSNTNLQSTVTTLANNPHITQNVDLLCANDNINYIMTLLNNNPQVIKDTQSFIESQIVSNSNSNGNGVTIDIQQPLDNQ